MPHDKNGSATGPGDLILGRSGGANDTQPEYLAVVTEVYPGTDTCNAQADVVARRLAGGSWAPYSMGHMTFTLGEVLKLDR